VADRLDVAERLAEGRPAVERTESYVRACRQLGYQHPDLTSHPAQIRDWYETEDGLDLYALDADCAQLRAVVDVVAEALRLQRAQVDELESAWTGPGADSALGFLRRHCEAGNTVATEVRAAAQRCESLRDNLWHLVDVKVATAIAIDDRTRAQRSAWLAAAEGVTTGAGDRQGSEELVQQQVMPYVDNDIRDEWVSAMRATRSGVAASYDMVTDRFAAAAPTLFEIPEDLRPGRAPFQPAGPPVAAAVAPGAARLAPGPEPAALPTASPAMATAAPPSPTGLSPAAPSGMAAMPGDAALPSGGMGDAGGLGGLGGLANRIFETMGGLLGSGREDPMDGEDPFDGDPFDPGDGPNGPFGPKDEDKAEHAGDKTDAEVSREAEPVGPPVAEVPQPGAVAQPAADLPPPAATPPLPAAAPARPEAAPAAVPPVGEGKTPCEIAADELPKAGQ
jgi:hypothetical protein